MPEQLISPNQTDLVLSKSEGFPQFAFTYTFPSFSSNHGIKWMSFPVLPEFQELHRNSLLSLLESLTLNINPCLDYCVWNNVYDNSNSLTHFDSYTGQWNPANHIVTSSQGYKVQMLPTNDTERVIQVSGFLPPPQTEVRLFGPHDEQSVENWVGYFSPKVKNVLEAFDYALENIYYIKGQDWTIMRDPTQPGHPWLLPASRPPDVKSGDMFIIKTYLDTNLIYDYNGPDREPKELPQPEHFEYVEKLDYVPIFVDFKGGDIPLPEEIAVYVNGDCKGAVVVTDSLAQVCAYICDGLPDNPELEFVLYYDSKHQDLITDYQVWNQKLAEYVQDKLRPHKKEDYYLVKIARHLNENTSVQLYLKNQPNPFNPQTVFKYFVPQAGRVKLSIYNAKGQLITKLVNDQKQAGMQEITWRGTDSNGKSCSSGVYYCRFNYEGHCVTKKVLLVR